MIPGIVASQSTGAGAASGGPIASDSAVIFNSAYLVGTLSCTDNEFFGFSGFFKTNWSTLECAFIVQDFMTSLSGFSAPPPHNIAFFANSLGDVHSVGIEESGTADTTWHHIIGAAKTNLAAGTKIIKLFIDGVDASGTKSDTHISFTLSSNNAPIWIGWNGDPFSSGIPKYNGSMCNLWIGPGIDLLTGSTISSTTIELFRKTNGCPEDPAVAIAALGTPAVFLAGNAAQFASNTLGAGGSFAIITGTLTDDPNGPCVEGTAVGSASGIGTAVAVGTSVGFSSGVGSSSGTGLASAASSASVARAGAASATGAASGVGRSINAANGTASGTGAGAAVGTTVGALTVDGITSLTFAGSFARDLKTTFIGGTRYTKSGSAIITFEDQSGNNNDFSDGGVTTRRPTETTAGPNTRLCADFDGSTNLLLTSVNASSLFSVSSGAVVIGCIIDAVTLNSGLNDTSNHGIFGDLNFKMGIYAANDSGIRLYSLNDDGGGIDQTGNTFFTTGTACVLMWRHHGGTLYYSINGGTEVTATSGNTANLSSVLLIGASGTNLTNMKIFEFFTTSDGSQTANLAAVIADIKSYIGA